jgi:hypothetical protein
MSKHAPMCPFCPILLPSKPAEWKRIAPPDENGHTLTIGGVECCLLCEVSAQVSPDAGAWLLDRLREFTRGREENAGERTRYDGQ